MAKAKNEMQVTLVRAPQDPPQFSDQHQQSLKALTSALEQEGVKVTPYLDMQASAAISGGLSGLLGIAIPAIMPVVGTIIGAWLTGRNGRKVRVKVGDIEVETASTEEAERLLERAAKIKGKVDAKS